MFNIIICDPNKNMAKYYGNMILKIASKNNLMVSIEYFESSEALLFHFSEEYNKIDIIYLDINIGKFNGIETAKELRNNNYNSQIIFLTSSTEKILEAFDVSALNYLIKNDNDSVKFEQVFKKAIELSNNNELFAFDFDGTITSVPIRDIKYFEIWKRVITPYIAPSVSHKFYGSMYSLEKALESKGFIRIHRSYLVNTNYIRRIDKGKLFLISGEKIPVGITYIKKAKIKYKNYLLDNHIFYSDKI